jgi:translation initiation factor 2 subunit 3
VIKYNPLIPEINIGTVGHVDHGKSTLVQAISGKWPATHSEELKRGITIKLGYADATIYSCKKCEKFVSNKCAKCMEKGEAIRTISFVDAPGHETLMATVLAGASLMDSVLFIIAANEKCPQPQTKEHLMVLGIVGIKNIIIVQTKIDLVSKEKALEHYNQIKKFVKGTIAENAPIIPISAQKNINVNYLLQMIQENFKTPERDLTKPSKMFIVRSFDVNKPGTEIKNLKGGVLGGALVQGELKINDEIELRPGIFNKGKWTIIKTKVIGLQKAGKNIKQAGAGGLLGVLTGLDPFLTKADSLAGSVAGKDLPDILNQISFKMNFLIDKTLSKDEQIMINIGTARTIGVIKEIKNIYQVDLKLPISASKGERIAISKKIEDRWRLIGWGLIE